MLSYASFSLFQLFEKKKKEKKKGCIHCLGSWVTLYGCLKNVTVLIAVSAALFECRLRLSNWTNKLSLPYVNKCRFFFSFVFVIGNLNVQLFLFLSLSFSLTVLGAGPFPSTAMIPPNLAACMRNEKLGEACFYLMGHNQTTVCSSINTRCFCAVA